VRKKLIRLAVATGLLTGVVFTPLTAAAYVRCSVYQGRSCAASSPRFLCYNAYPYEPGYCDCYNSVWECG
jgi:hypothetical protein